MTTTEIDALVVELKIPAIKARLKGVLTELVKAETDEAEARRLLRDVQGELKIEEHRLSADVRMAGDDPKAKYLGKAPKNEAEKTDLVALAKREDDNYMLRADTMGRQEVAADEATIAASKLRREYGALLHVLASATTELAVRAGVVR